jgi:1,6-anhydro-N-acetylmuramate kinase
MPDLLDDMLSDAYFLPAPAPKSTGKERFNLELEYHRTGPAPPGYCPRRTCSAPCCS